MTRYRFKNVVFKWVHGCFGLILLALPTPSCAATFSMDYSLGFNGYFQAEKWTPLTVVLENRGRTISGTLEVLVTSGSEYRKDVHQTTYSMEVELPYNSRKRCPFTILTHSTKHEMIIRFRNVQKTFFSNSVSLRSYDTGKGLAVVLDPAISPDFLTNLPDSVFPVLVRPEFLPETWYGYDGVRMLILNAGMLKHLRERQFQALEQWIKMGGYLVAAGGVNYGSLLTNRMKRLLPMTIQGHKQLFEIKAFETFSGQKLAGPSPFLVLNVKIEQSDVLLEEDGLPIISQKRIGNGKIVFLSFDIQSPPFSRWDKRRVFWDKIVSYQSLPEDKGFDLPDQKILDSMLSGIRTGFPGFWLSLGFLSVYLSLVGFFFKRLKKKKLKETRRRTCLYLLTVILAFSAASYGFFFYPGEKQYLTYNNFLQVNISGGNMNTAGKYIIGLYSIKNGEYNMHFSRPPYPLTHLLADTAGTKIPNPYVLTETPAGTGVRGYIKKWAHSFFVINTRMDFSIQGEAILSERALHITIENMTPYEIKDCLLYFDGRFFEGEDIIPHKKQIIKIAKRDINAKKMFTPQEFKNPVKEPATGDTESFLQTMQDRLSKDLLFSIHSKYKSKRNTLHLIGWIPSGIITPRFKEPGIMGEGLTLINWEIPIKMI